MARMIQTELDGVVTGKGEIHMEGTVKGKLYLFMLQLVEGNMSF